MRMIELADMKQDNLAMMVKIKREEKDDVDKIKP